MRDQRTCVDRLLSVNYGGLYIQHQKLISRVPYYSGIHVRDTLLFGFIIQAVL